MRTEPSCARPRDRGAVLGGRVPPVSAALSSAEAERRLPGGLPGERRLVYPAPHDLRYRSGALAALPGHPLPDDAADLPYRRPLVGGWLRGSGLPAGRQLRAGPLV